MLGKLFYIIYNSYYKHGEYKNDIPLLTVWGILVISFWSLTDLGFSVIHAFWEPTARLPSLRGISMPVFILYSLLYYLFIIFRKRHIKIYNRYKDDPFLNSKTGSRLGWFFIIASILLPFIFALLWNKIVFGAWV